MSMALPFVLLVMASQPKGLGIGVLLLDFLALCTLLITSIIITVKAWKRGRGWLYSVGAVAAVVLFFLCVKPIRKTVDYFGFKLKQRHLEVLVLNPNNSQQLDATGIMRVETSQPGVLLFVEDGEASYQYWGVAYSPMDKKPSSRYLAHKLYYWHHLEGHWYSWARYDD
ncbi:hypothetical protein [Hymenobacter edaphi]|uniref:Uncharacterized protein n=1 Tax=Hymenobacter edaphi TaxID=2211146 RepID=A0A328BS32_9BACT|nr:hypothetical protein [Hymenobacter edaphi]RAK69515.1 hypothetical protein DLM85_01230 [Hymenobacter edaphi]